MKFWIKCIPPKSTGQAGLRIMKKKNGQQFIGKFASSKSKKTQEELMTLLRPYVPDSPMEGPIKLFVFWCYPWRKAEPKKNRVLGRKHCDTRPDCDNLCKMLQDNMSRLGFWCDDAQIAHLEFIKYWADNPGIGIEITELPEVPRETATQQELL